MTQPIRNILHDVDNFRENLAAFSEGATEGTGRDDRDRMDSASELAHRAEWWVGMSSGAVAAVP